MKHRRSKGLRRRYGRAVRGRIGSRGIEATETIHLTPGHTYAMGASSSPSLVDIISATSDRIVYKSHGHFGDTSERVTPRWVGEDLIARGERTFRASHGVSAHEWVHLSDEGRTALVAKHLRGKVGGRY
jgi:hypothetical protein